MADDGGSKLLEENRSILPDSEKDYVRAIVEKMNKIATHRDPLIPEIGLFCFKMVLVLNGGAVIALMGLYPELIYAKKAGSVSTTKIGSALADAGELFLFGLLVAGVAAMLTYLHQSLIIYQNSFIIVQEDQEGRDDPDMTELEKLWTIWISIRELYKNQLTLPQALYLILSITLSRFSIDLMPLLTPVLIFISSILCLFSFGLFAWGGFSVLDALRVATGG